MTITHTPLTLALQADLVVLHHRQCAAAVMQGVDHLRTVDRTAPQFGIDPDMRTYRCNLVQSVDVFRCGIDCLDPAVGRQGAQCLQAAGRGAGADGDQVAAVGTNLFDTLQASGVEILPSTN